FCNPTVAAHTNIVGLGVASAGPSQQQQFLGSPILGPAQPTQSIVTGPATTSGQATLLPQAFTTGTLHDPTTGAWNMDTVGDGHCIHVTNTGYSILSTPSKSLVLNNVLITPHIVKNLISIRQFVHDNDCTIEFDSFGFSVKDFMTRRVLLRCYSTRDLYPVTAPSPIPHAFHVSQHMWHQRLGHPESEVLLRLVSNNVISCNKEKPPTLCHACQLGKHVRLPFVSSSTIVSSCFDIVHSDSIISSLHQEFAMTDLGALNYIMGILVSRDSSRIFLSQKKYAVEILKRAGDMVSDLTLYRSLAGSL
ncbi:ribonuclease H-like domain-containing protein, partial [Tanacetum coccineum]